MWNTTMGCRILKGAEAELVCNAACRLVDDIRARMPGEGEPAESIETGIDPFDRLTPEQQIVLVERVIGFLTDPELKAPRRSALTDSVVASVYSQIHVDTEYEIDMEQMATTIEDGDTEWREMIVAALLEKPTDVEAPRDFAPGVPDPECVVMETWELAIATLRDRILPDEDWSMDAWTPDLSPEASRELKQKMGITRDYFTEVPPDATRADARSAWANLIERVTDERPGAWRFGDRPIQPLLLADVIGELEIQSEEWCSYANMQTGEVIGLPSDIFSFLETEEDVDDYSGDGTDEMIDIAREIYNSDHFVRLADKFDVHEWSIMREFCDTVQREDIRSDLLAAIHGSGAFRRFQTTLDRFDLSETWHRYRINALAEFAIQWLEDNRIPWVHQRNP